MISGNNSVPVQPGSVGISRLWGSTPAYNVLQKNSGGVRRTRRPGPPSHTGAARLRRVQIGRHSRCNPAGIRHHPGRGVATSSRAARERVRHGASRRAAQGVRVGLCTTQGCRRVAGTIPGILGTASGCASYGDRSGEGETTRPNWVSSIAMPE